MNQMHRLLGQSAGAGKTDRVAGTVTPPSAQAVAANSVDRVQDLENALQRLAEKVRQANGIQHSGTRISAEDWSELHQLTNEAFGLLAQGKEPNRAASAGVLAALADDSSEAPAEADVAIPLKDQVEDLKARADQLACYGLKGFKVIVERDPEPPNPRKEFDNVGKMACFHRRYTLGDEDHGIRSEENFGWAEMEAAIEQEHPGALILPLFLFDHSGITISTKPFGDSWDSGRLGLIFATAEKIKDEWGDGPDAREHAASYLEGEVETYDQYLRGDVYGYRVLDPDGAEDDATWGIFGDEAAKGDARDALVSAVEAITPDWAALKTTIRAWNMFEGRQDAMSAKDFVKALQNDFQELQEMNVDWVSNQSFEGADTLIKEAGFDPRIVKDAYPDDYDSLRFAVEGAMKFNVEAVAPGNLFIRCSPEIELPDMTSRQEDDAADSELNQFIRAAQAAGFTEQQAEEVYRNATYGGMAGVGVIAEGNDVVEAWRQDADFANPHAISGTPILYCADSMNGSGHFLTRRGSHEITVPNLPNAIDYGRYSLGAVFGTNQWSY